MSSSSESHGSHDLNAPANETPETEQGGDGIVEKLRHQHKTVGVTPALREALELYYGAQPIEDGMEAHAWAEILAGRVTAVRIDKSRHCTHPLMLTSSASALISQRDARIEELTREVERLRNVVAKDPKTLMIAFEDGDHMRLSRAAGDAQKRADLAELREGALMRDCEVYKGHASDQLERALEAEAQVSALRAALTVIRLKEWAWEGGGSEVRFPTSAGRIASQALGLPVELPDGWPSRAEYEALSEAQAAINPAKGETE